MSLSFQGSVTLQQFSEDYAKESFLIWISNLSVFNLCQEEINKFTVAFIWKQVKNLFFFLFATS